MLGEQPSVRRITLFEILIVGGIVALVLFSTGIALSAARERARDYKRLADIARIQSALELYFNDTNAYPATDGAIALGEDGSYCLTDVGFSNVCTGNVRVYLLPVPSQTPIGLSSSELAFYAYQSNGETYTLSFMIERAVPQVEIQKGLMCARPGKAIVPAPTGSRLCD